MLGSILSRLVLSLKLIDIALIHAGNIIPPASDTSRPFVEIVQMSSVVWTSFSKKKKKINYH